MVVTPIAVTRHSGSVSGTLYATDGAGTANKSHVHRRRRVS